MVIEWLERDYSHYHASTWSRTRMERAVQGHSSYKFLFLYDENSMVGLTTTIIDPNDMWWWNIHWFIRRERLWLIWSIYTINNAWSYRSTLISRIALQYILVILRVIVKVVCVISLLMMLVKKKVILNLLRSIFY